MSQRQSGIGGVTHLFANCEDNLMLTLLRIITTLSGLGLLLVGVIWWLQPATAAEILGASLLDAVAPKSATRAHFLLVPAGFWR